MLREKTILLLLVSTVLVGVPAKHAIAGITSRHAPISEVMLLPQFCWGQYLNYKQPQYNIPRGCGAGMNHYCQGLIFLNQGERVFDNMGKKRNLLHNAKRRFKYTLDWMKKYPNCPLRQAVNESLRRVDMDLRTVPAR
ncbi:MAG: hypothetical protein P8180_13590 [Gammaproteobacteria bacterium]